jgi:hypothetical protein
LKGIFKHFSLLFRPRKFEIHGHNKQKDALDEAEAFHQYVDLCNKVLVQNIGQFVKLHSACFSQDTWVVLLKVLIGVGDTILSKPKGKVDADNVMVQMGDKLCEAYSKVISLDLPILRSFSMFGLLARLSALTYGIYLKIILSNGIIGYL